MNDFIKEHYFKEIERKYAIESSCTTFISIISVLLASELAFWLSMLNGAYSFKYNVIYIYIAMATILVIQIVGIIQSLRSYNNLFEGFEYEMVPFYSEIEDIRRDYSKQNEFENEFLEILQTSIDANQKHNDNRSEYLFSAKSWLIASLLPLFFIFVFITVYSTPNNRCNHSGTKSINSVGMKDSNITSKQKEFKNDTSQLRKYQESRKGKGDTTAPRQKTQIVNKKG